MRYYLFVFILSVSTAAFAGEKIDKTLQVKPGGKVSISIVRGNVAVEAWDKAEVRVTGELDEAAEKFIFETSGNETSVKVELNDDSYHRSWNSDDTELTVYMPAMSSLECGGVSTDFTVSGIQGGINANSVSGDLVLKKVGKSIRAETVSGDISVTDSAGKMKLATVSGDIEARGKAEHFDVNTVSGDLDASIGKAGLVDLSSVSGDLELEFELAEDGEVEAGTVSGDVTLKFENEVVNARFKLETGPGGDIENDITKDVSESSFIGAENIKFTSGNGKGSVDIETMSGSITVEK